VRLTLSLPEDRADRRVITESGEAGMPQQAKASLRARLSPATDHSMTRKPQRNQVRSTVDRFSCARKKAQRRGAFVD
jgi:hypothetical protein